MTNAKHRLYFKLDRSKVRIKINTKNNSFHVLNELINPKSNNRWDIFSCYIMP